MGSNGLTSTRHDVFAKYLAERHPESFDAAVPDELVYSGGVRLDTPVEHTGVTALRSSCCRPPAHMPL